MISRYVHQAHQECFGKTFDKFRAVKVSGAALQMPRVVRGLNAIEIKRLMIDQLVF